MARDLDDTASVTGAFAGRDGHEVEALVTDRYLEALLAAHARGADHAPAAAAPPDAIRRAADRLAARPAALAPVVPLRGGARLPAGRGRGPDAPRDSGRRRRPRRAAARRRDLGLDGLDPDDDGDDRARYGRPLLIGGALTSAALSLAGAAYVAWRLNRPTDNPMARAARAVARSRLV